MNSLDLLRNSLKLLGRDGEHWVKECPSDADSHCIMTALNKVYQFSDYPGLQVFTSAMASLENSIPEGFSLGKDKASLVKFNDHPDTTFADIQTLYNNAIKSLEA